MRNGHRGRVPRWPWIDSVNRLSTRFPGQTGGTVISGRPA